MLRDVEVFDLTAEMCEDHENGKDPVLVAIADFDLGPSTPLQAVSERLQPG